ncbi:MAG: hypothetical protein Q4A06_04765, partial [Cardiobacteriaceae bacterium]|nr:hypothetical protein [Cardiobacteriaceae bacterium]
MKYKVQLFEWQEIGLGKEGEKVFQNIFVNKFGGDFPDYSLFLGLRFTAARPVTFFASPKKVTKERRPRGAVFPCRGAFGGGLVNSLSLKH